VFAATLGICGLVAAGSVALDAATESLAHLDLSNTRDWRQAALFGTRAIALIGYAAAHAAICWRPSSGHAIVARAAFTVAGGVVAVLMVRSVLNAPPSSGCGMKWLADLAPFLIAAGFAAVEVAAWVGWWVGGVRPAELDAAPDSARDVGSGTS
jgi:hypothetical protein